MSPAELGAAVPAAVKSRRLFFALWPDAVQRERLAETLHAAVRGSGGRPVPAAQLHVTLAFLGSVPVPHVTRLTGIAGAAAHAAGLPGRPIELSLDRLEHWRRPQVLCALPARPPAALGALAAGLVESLRKGGFAPDLKPFRPHVTVARKVARPSEPAALPPVRWRFDAFALIESLTLESGPVYSVVEAYSLYAERV
jgi:2'-5' RNA ligase